MSPKKTEMSLPSDPLWYKDAIIYELHVRAFYDHNGDGIGDFRGLTEKLDYLQNLGVTAIWLLPFYPSPLKDDGYDIADYTNVHPSYGTLNDVKAFVREAHQRGLRVITELVCNHTSDQHPWFQRARHARPGSAARRMYVWSDTPDKYQEARIIFKDFETSNWAWDAEAKAYYWHRFYSHQPDLNYDSQQVRNAIFRVMDFWLEMGVDGLRLDAVPYLYERDGTNCENLPDTHVFLRALRLHIDERFRDRMLLAEANQWPEDSVAYFGNGDECHMAFHFPLMPRMFMAIHMEDRFPIIDILAQTPPIPETAQWALFLRNHDELTLEMVTDEERDYMYRVYANEHRARINLGIRRRLAPLLSNSRRKIELMNGLLFSLPGTPVLYYGDEIGMGDNIYLGDRNGVRTPMQWSADRNAGFSRTSPHRLYLPVITEPEYHYETVNVEAQQNNPSSLLWWMKRLIALRKHYTAFSRGSLEFLHPENRKVLAFLRRYENEQLLVIANLSRFVQYIELDLSPFQGMMPVELFGRTKFPPIGDSPYFITLGPHTFYWFALEPRYEDIRQIRSDEHGPEIPIFRVDNAWQELFEANSHTAPLTSILPAYFLQRRWFWGKVRLIAATRVIDFIPLSHGSLSAYITLIRVDYTEGYPETYVLPLAYATREDAERVLQHFPRRVIAHVQINSVREEGIVYDPSEEPGFSKALLDMITNRRRLKGLEGELYAPTTQVFRSILKEQHAPLEPTTTQFEQSNTSLIYGDRLILKIFRRLEEGLHPDLEIGQFLTEQRNFEHIPPVAGALEYRRRTGEAMTVAILQKFVPNQGDAWLYTLDVLGPYFEWVLAAQMPTPEPIPLSARSLLSKIEQDLPQIAREMIGTYIEQVRLLGQRTAEMHIALAGASKDPNFTPEPFTLLYQRSIYQSMRTQTHSTFHTLRNEIKRLPTALQEDTQKLLDREDQIIARFQSIINRKIAAMRLRHHGDYHLGKVLYTGKDFTIIDFEGDPARPLSERRLKRSPLRDVAAMLRSFSYAASTVLINQTSSAIIRPEDHLAAITWADFWTFWVSAAFLKEYLNKARQATFLPSEREDLELLLDTFLLEKAIYELNYELNNRPAWILTPIRGLLQLLEAGNTEVRIGT